MAPPLVSVAREEQIREGKTHVVSVGGVRVLLTRVGEQLHAIDDTCTHAGCSLGAGRLDDTVVTCPCHGSQFDVTTGQVVRGPAQRPVRHRAVTVSGGDVLVET